MTPQHAERESPEPTLSELAVDARRSLRSWRNTKLALGAVMTTLGVLGIGVLAAAASLEELLVIGSVFLLVAILPGALFFAWGWRPVDRHPLVIALEQHPATVRDVRFAYLERLTGHTRIATITLADGTAHGIELAPPSRR